MREAYYQFIETHIKYMRWAKNILDKYYYQYEAQPKAQHTFEKIATRINLTPERLFNLCGLFTAYQIEHEGLGRREDHEVNGSNTA